jgi:MoaA/NifB/PqqE/SkfB family radical SAM enzyme
LCAKYNYKFTLVSNGSFFKKYWNFLKNHLQNLSFISLSLDGSRPEIHDKQRNQPGSFENVISAIKFYQKKGIRCLGLTTCLTKYNKNDIIQIVNLCKNIGIKNIKFLEPLLTREGDDYHLNEKELKILLMQIRKAVEQFASDINIKIGSHQHLIKPKQVNFCDVLDNPHFSVDSEGGLTFCCDLYQLPNSRPNILKDGFKESISLNAAIIDELKVQRAHDLSKNKFLLPPEFYNCTYCNNNIENAILKVRYKNENKQQRRGEI